MSSTNIVKAGFATLKGHWPEVLVMMAIPLTMTAISVGLTLITGYFSLLLLPLAVPFFYNVYERIWSLAAQTPSRPYNFGLQDYIGNRGIRGAFGLLTPTLFCAILANLITALALSYLAEPLTIALGHGDVIEQIKQILDSNNANILADLVDFIENGNMQALSGAIMVAVGLGTLIAGIFFFFLAENRRFHYVLVQRVLPDADKNIPAGQARLMGKNFACGLWGERIKRKLPLLLPELACVTTVYIAGVTGFTFWETTAPYAVTILPILLALSVLLPFMVLSAAGDVHIVDALLPAVYQRMDETQRQLLRRIFKSVEYRHSAARAGQKLFQGCDQEPDAAKEEEVAETVGTAPTKPTATKTKGIIVDMTRFGQEENPAKPTDENDHRA